MSRHVELFTYIITDGTVLYVKVMRGLREYGEISVVRRKVVGGMGLLMSR